MSKSIAKEWKMQRDDVEKLISYYKRNKCLWDFRSNEYKRFELKKLAWQRMGKIFGKQPNEIKLKVKYLRAAYAAEKRKVDSARETGRKYIPSLYYYYHMNFLDNIIICRKDPGLDNCDDKDTMSDPIAESKEETSQTYFDEQEESHESVHNESLNSPPSSPPPSSLKRPSNVFQSSSKKPRISAHCTTLDAAVSTLAEAANTASGDTVYTAFGRTMALQLSQMSPLEATVTMSEIHEALSKCIIKSMLSKNRHSNGNL